MTQPAIDEGFRSARDWGPTMLTTSVVVGVIALVSMVPFAFLVISSLVGVDGEAIGATWLRLFSRMPVALYMFNSGVVSLGASLLVMIVSSMAGFAISKLSSRFTTLIFAGIVAAISVPLATTILPNYLNFARLGAIGQYWGPIVIYASLSVPFSTVLMTSFYHNLPDELVESALIDGASYPQIYLSIMLRMAGPALVTVGVLSFLGSWNDLLIGLLFLPDPAMRTISVGVAALQGVRSTAADAKILLTGSLLSAMPPVVAFLLFQKYLISGIVSGVTK